MVLVWSRDHPRLICMQLCCQVGMGNARWELGMSGGMMNAMSTNMVCVLALEPSKDAAQPLPEATPCRGPFLTPTTNQLQTCCQHCQCVLCLPYLPVRCAHVLSQLVQAPHISILVLSVVGDVASTCCSHGNTWKSTQAQTSSGNSSSGASKSGDIDVNMHTHQLGVY